MKRLTFYIGLMWKPFLSALVLLGVLFATYFYKLLTLTAGFSAQEVFYTKSVDSISKVLDMAAFLPVNFISFLAIKLIDIDSLRYVGTAIGFLGVIGMYLLLHKWHTRRISLAATFMYGSSVLALTSSRVALPFIALSLSPWLVYLYLNFDKKHHANISFVALAVLAAILIYLPGFSPLLLALLIWKRKSVIGAIKSTSNWIIAMSFLVGLVILIPLMLISARDPSELLIMAGLPDNIPNIRVIFDNFANNLIGLFWDSSKLKMNSAGTAGILDVFTITMLITGIIVAINRRSQVKMILPFLALIFSLLFASVGGLVTLSMALPVVYILVAIGLSWLLQQWLAVFPRNPVARNIGVSLILIAVSISTIYNYYRYFIAWPNMPSTKITYNIKP